jgi:hypothetical protein
MKPKQNCRILYSTFANQTNSHSWELDCRVAFCSRARPVRERRYWPALLLVRLVFRFFIRPDRHLRRSSWVSERVAYAHFLVCVFVFALSPQYTVNACFVLVVVVGRLSTVSICKEDEATEYYLY